MKTTLREMTPEMVQKAMDILKRRPKKSTATGPEINQMKAAHKTGVIHYYRDSCKLVAMGLEGGGAGIEIEDAAQILAWAFVVPAAVVMRDLEMLLEQ